MRNSELGGGRVGQEDAMDAEARIRDRLWYRKTMKALTREQFETELREKVEREEITADEAEDEYRDRYDPEPRYCGQEW